MAENLTINSTSTSSSDVIMASIGVIGVLSNIFLLVIIIRSKKFQDVSYMFVINVALSDFLTSFVLCCLFLPKILIPDFMSFVGYSFCKILYFVFASTYDASAFSLIIISIYRFKIITDPLHYRSNSLICKHSAKVILIMWIISGLISAPAALLTTTTYIGEARCDVYYPFGYTPNIIYFTSFFFITYVIPLTMMSHNYIRISKDLYSRTYPKNYGNLLRVRLPRHNRNKSVIQFLIGITCAYMITSGPIFLGLMVLSIAGGSYTQLRESNYLLSRLLVASLGISASTCFINPTLCLIFDKNIRSEIRRILYKTPPESVVST
ncbi:Prokineticin receptor 1 [Trichoplax sp. H2]|nr:Prokineticin receptor 1 [Trichoplax sp. H2]|eukprot:RDD39678.1 Prokineticin receptor 1 [Trichoplax sp. H2]